MINQSKFKKMALGIGALGIILAPISAIVACGKTKVGRYDTKNDETIVIQSTFSTTGTQRKALDAIVQVYNELPKEEQPKGYMKVQSVPIAGGYGTIPGNLKIKFNAKDKSTLPNLIIDYPSAAAIFKSYKMELNVKDAFKPNVFDENLIAINDKIGGIKPGGIYSVPLGLSTIAQAINLPLFAYVINEIEKLNSANISETHALKIKEYQVEGNKSTQDLVAIQQLWGSMKTYNGPKVTDEIFTDFEKLFNFVSAAQVGFDIKINNKKSLHLLAIDSPTNLLQILTFLFGGGDYSKFLYTINSDGYVKMNFLEDKESEGYKNFEKTINLINKHIAKGSLWIGGIGAYGSNLLVNHQSMFSMGSTAGATHWYIEKGNTVIKEFANAQFQGEIFYDQQEIVKAATTQTTFSSGRYTNNIINHIDTPTAADKKSNSYNLMFINGMNDALATPIISTKPYLVEINMAKNVDFQKAFPNAQEIAQKVNADAITKKYYAISTIDKTKFEEAIKISATQYGKIKGKLKPKGFVDRKVIQGSQFKKGNYQNKILEYKQNVNDDEKAKNKYNLMFVNGMNGAKLREYVTGADKLTHLALVFKENEENFIAKFPKAKLVATKYGDQVNSKTKIYAIAEKHIEKLGKEKTVQENEVIGIAAPSQITSVSRKKIIFQQGPSFIPIHANQAENVGTKTFLKWFYETTQEHSFTIRGDKEPTVATPLNLFMSRAQYVVPIHNAFVDNSPIKETIYNGIRSKSGKYWKGAKLTWDIFNSAEDNSDTIVMVTPIDDFTSILRKQVLDVSIKGMYTSAHADEDGATTSLNKIYDKIKTLAKSNDII